MATHHFIATFLLIIFTTSLTTAQVVINEIYDTDGDIVLTGKPYYVLPVVQRRGGGISTAPVKADQTCPLAVIQETSTSALGTPVMFYREGSSTQNVTFNKDMNVAFDAANSCNESPVWKVKLVEGTTTTRFVGLGGLLMARGPNFADSWFRIERFFPRFHFDYKLKVCPAKNICPTCKVTCGDLGVVVHEDGTWRLVVGASPLRIKFKKA